MKKLFIIFFTILFSVNSSVAYSKGEKFIDSDWNKFLRFLLYNGQVGKFSTDHKKRIKGEPYKERADVKQWSKIQKKSQRK